jgi:N-acetylglucosamine-6-phosphate deacetylase
MQSMDSLPGFVDLQVNGYGGISFATPGLALEDARTACRGLLARGAAAVFPTVITAPLEVLRENLSLLNRLMSEPEFAGRLPGIHLEGPFISPSPGAVGAHDARWVVPAEPEVFDDLQAAAGGRIRILTLAADADGAADLTRHATQSGVRVALGHHLASEADLARLVEAGACFLTHMGNGVPAMLPRHSNPIWYALANDNLSATIIPDGHHLPPYVIKTFLRAKGPERLAVVSDAAALAGMPPGEYTQDGRSVVLEASGRLHDPAKGCLAGSSATILECMNYLSKLQLLSFDDLWAVGFDHPIALANLGVDDIDTSPRLRYEPSPARFHLLADEG